MSGRSTDIGTLWRERPRSRFVRWSIAGFLALLAFSWLEAGADLGELLSSASAETVARYWERDLKPVPLRGHDWDWGVFGAWAGRRLDEGGVEAMTATLAVSILAIVFAALFGTLLALPAARTFACPEPFLPLGREPGPWARWAWRLGRQRHARALDPDALAARVRHRLPAHGDHGRDGVARRPRAGDPQRGILGRLNAEVIENLPDDTLKALRAGGAGRLQVAAVGVLPAALPRFLLYFFYRWETCVREATVLGMLGLVGLGYLMKEAGAHEQDDRLVFYVLLASAIVLAGDFVSAIARSLVRRAS